MKYINHSSISIQAMIDIYQKLINNGSIKEGDAGYIRMNELKLRYKKGQRYFKK
jgi:hypothetical protein